MELQPAPVSRINPPIPTPLATHPVPVFAMLPRTTSLQLPPSPTASPTSPPNRYTSDLSGLGEALLPWVEGAEEAEGAKEPRDRDWSPEARGWGECISFK